MVLFQAAIGECHPFGRITIFYSLAVFHEKPFGKGAYLNTVLDFGREIALRFPRRRAERQATERWRRDTRKQKNCAAAERGADGATRHPYPEQSPDAPSARSPS